MTPQLPHTVAETTMWGNPRLLSQVLNEGDVEIPGALLLLPAHRQMPKRGLQCPYLLILRFLSFNGVRNESYSNPEPVEIHRHHSW